MSEPLERRLREAVTRGLIVPRHRPFPRAVALLPNLLETAMPPDLSAMLTIVNGFRRDSIQVYSGPSITMPESQWYKCDLVSTTRQWRRMCGRVREASGTAFWTPEQVKGMIVIGEDGTGCPFIWLPTKETSSFELIRLDRETLQEFEHVSENISGFIYLVLEGTVF
jgi:hypothetical protein